MKNLVLVAACLLGGSACIEPRDPEAYLGLTPPGLEPEVFAPGVISKSGVYEYGSVWSADGRELYFGVNVGERAEIRTIRWSEGAWTGESVVVGHPDYTFGDPFLSPDGLRLYFISDRPLDQLGGPPKDFDIWFVERQAHSWGEPVNVGEPVNSESGEYYISFSAEGRLYFASNVNSGERRHDFDVYAAHAVASGFGTPEPLPGEVNTRAYEADAFVGPDESYVIYSSARREGLGKGDLYVSFRLADGSWGNGINLGDRINTAGHELCPFVTADSRFFFYTSAEDIYWVDAAILEEFRER